MGNIEKTVKIHVKGLVQGVGFRPFVYRLAKDLKLLGNVANRTDGVLIYVEGREEDIKNFYHRLMSQSPPAANIIHTDYVETTKNGFSSFEIVKSSDANEGITDISPDIAVCNDCLNDIQNQSHRINYPLTNCTNCGPRFSIIERLPYDRWSTTMRSFKMCPTCRSEYADVNDRRFHAQPVACMHCGPSYSMIYQNKRIYSLEDILDKTAELIESGGVIALKGVGGYQLTCNAYNKNPVSRIRTIKNRKSRPLAVMFNKVKNIEKYCNLSFSEKKWLQSWRRPILLADQFNKLNELINPQLDQLGVILPYMPFHYLLFEKLKTDALIFTSANETNDPILFRDDEEIEKLQQVCDIIVCYNRQIANFSDDSVVSVNNNLPVVIRRSRGYVPSPVYVQQDVNGILALGAEFKNSFCLGVGEKAILSQYFGDLKNFKVYELYKETIKRFVDIYKTEPEYIVADMHPDFVCTQNVNTILEKIYDNKLIRVQHHHAHLVSCMAENNLDEKVIGVCMDGTGYGSDGKTWGSEFLVCDTLDYRRMAHFDYIPLPGGDIATKEIWRMALSYLYAYFGSKAIQLKVAPIEIREDFKWKAVCELLLNGVDMPESCGCGRLFDAVAALLNICQFNSFDAEAPMKLEALVDSNINDKYNYSNKNGIISFKETFREILHDLQSETGKAIMASKFHNTVSDSIIKQVLNMRAQTKISKVVLSGGSFQNRYLLSKVYHTLSETGFSVYYNTMVPMNDSGLSLGQLIIGAKKIKQHVLKYSG